MKIKREDIYTVIQSFYRQAIDDILIGFHFNQIRHHLDDHLERITTFWEIQLTGTSEQMPTVSFDLVKTHYPMSLNEGQINRWIFLFRENIQNINIDDRVRKEWLKKVDLFAKRLIENSIR